MSCVLHINRAVALILPLAFLCGAARAIESGIGGTLPQAHHVSVRAVTGSSDLEIYEYDNRGEGTSAVSERFIELGYGLTDNLAVMARYGSMEWDPEARSGGIYPHGPSWGVGAHLSLPLWFNDQVDLSAEWAISYTYGDPGDRRRGSGDIFAGEVEWWQSCLAGVCQWRCVQGYAGVRYSQVDLVYTHDSNEGIRRGGYEEESPINFFGGARVTLHEHVSAFIELQRGSVEGTFYGIAFSIPLPGDPLNVGGE